jgi:hypothetical protein
MAAPNVSLYAVTIMAQPSFQEENPDINSFQRMHRMVYLPCMHFLFSMCILGMTASVYSLIVRWKGFRKLPFSPAHAAFCGPFLSHANAVQAYRAAVLSFSNLTAESPLLIVLYTYWLTVIICGTCVTVCIIAKYLMSLPNWTHFDLVSLKHSVAPCLCASTNVIPLKTFTRPIAGRRHRAAGSLRDSNDDVQHDLVRRDASTTIRLSSYSPSERSWYARVNSRCRRS